MASDISLIFLFRYSSPEQKHQCTEKGLKIVVLIDVTLIIQLDVSEHL